MTPGQAVAAGVDFLRRAAVGGRWSAFHLHPGVSDEWVTAYVAALLAEARVPGTDALVAAATAALRGRQRRDGRFGFHARAIGDADSTLWALRLGAATGDFPGDRPAAAAALAAHVRRDGVATYAADEPIRTIIEAGPERSMKGWCGAHPCVTAVAAGLADTAAGAAAALRAQQRRDGSWPAYWWAAPEYTVAHAAEALGGEAASRAARWAAARLASGPPSGSGTPADGGADGAGHGTAYGAADVRRGGAFASALALRAMVAGGAPDAAVGPTVDRLCRQLRLDGAWPASAVLRVPDPDDPDPDTPGLTRWVPGGRKEGAVILDRTGVFTTATVVAALARADAP